MESSKNIINGTIETNGGDVVNGNNNTIVNFIDSLSFLLTEYREQLNQIHVLILAFKPKTALGLLTNLENRIKESNAKKDNKITSKLLYLKALCKRELEDFTKEDSAQDFIKAFNLNKEDETIKYRACSTNALTYTFYAVFNRCAVIHFALITLYCEQPAHDHVIGFSWLNRAENTGAKSSPG